MHKIAKAILITSASLIAILLLIVVGAHLYVESAPVQSRIEAAVSQKIRMPVKAHFLRFSLWSGLRIEGLVVGESAEEPFAKIPEVSAKVAWSPLIFSRRLVIRELEIHQPEVNWQQSPKGKWQLPQVEKEKKDDQDKAKDEPKESKEAKEEKKPREKKEPGAKKPERQRVEFKIEQAHITNGHFLFKDRKGRTLASLEGVTVLIPLFGLHEARGEAAIERVQLREKLKIDAISTPFNYQDDTLTLSGLSATIAGGKVTGSGTLQPQSNDAPFSTSASFSGVDLRQLLSELEARGFTDSEGKLHGSIELSGDTGNSKSITGKGEAHLEGGRLEQYPLLQMLGQTLRIDELTRLDLQQARLVTTIHKARVNVEDLTLQSTNLVLSATGQVRFDQKMDLDALLVLNEKIARQIPSLVRSNFVANGESGQISLPFKVTGTLENPDTDLVRALMGERLERQASSLFRAFRELTGSSDKDKKSEKKKKKKDKKK